VEEPVEYQECAVLAWPKSWLVHLAEQGGEGPRIERSHLDGQLCIGKIARVGMSSRYSI